MVFASFVGVISNTDHRHFCLPNFPEALNHTSVANQCSFAANCANRKASALPKKFLLRNDASCDLQWLMRDDCVGEMQQKVQGI